MSETPEDTETPAAPSAGVSLRRRQAAFGFIFVSAVANVLSFGLIIPILPNLIKQFTGGDAAAASEWNVVFATTWGVMQFFCGPILGLLSDRFGRRPVLLISLFGLGLDFLMMAFAPSLMWLFVARVISGATSATFAAANAYVADVTAPENRAKAFGWMGSAMGFGFLVGPTLGGVLGEIDLRLPFLVAAGLTLVNWLYGVFILPESMPVERRTARFEWRRANPLGSLRLLRSHPDLLGLASIGFLAQLTQMAWPTIFVLYTGYRYGWTSMTVGLAMGASSLLGILVQATMVGRVVAKIGERGALLLGAGSVAVAFAWVGLAPTGKIYLISFLFGALGSFLQPGLQGLMTRRVGHQEQGQLQGANQSLVGVAALIGPALFGLTFAWSIRHEAMHMPGLAWMLGSALMGVAFLLAVRFARKPQAALA